MLVELKEGNDRIIHSGEYESIAKAVEHCAKNGIMLSCVDLHNADLSYADLSHAEFTCANLSGAILHCANLWGACLNDADLSGAKLSDANLCCTRSDNVNLSNANLTGAVLYSADIVHANLTGATMPFGETWEDYLAKVVPALLIAGGKDLKQILDSGCWDCHDWKNCPMYEAFGIDSPEEGPALLIPRIKEFVMFFDAELIPKPTV